MDEKIIIALEKLSNAIRVLLWDRAHEETLSPIQLQFLIFLHTHNARLRRVSILAREFGLTRATVSDAVRVLGVKRLISRRAHETDRRVSILTLTPRGRKQARRLSNWSDAIRGVLREFTSEIKHNIIVFLIEVIASLQKRGIISIARMCVTCDNFQKNARPGSDKPHYCRLTARYFAFSDMDIDCEEHIPEFIPH